MLIKKAEIDSNVISETIRSESAVSGVLNVGVVVPRFRIRLCQKGLHKTLITGKNLSVSIPVISLVE